MRQRHFLFAVASAVAIGAPASAQKAAPAASVAGPSPAPATALATPPPTPAALLGTARLAAVNRAVTAASLPTQKFVPPAQMRLDLARPLAGPAILERAGAGFFWASPTNASEGGYTFLTDGFAQLRLPTERGKTYVLDCRVQSVDPTFAIRRGTREPFSQQRVVEESGHVVHAFRADAATTTLVVSNRGSWHFFGCEITRLD